MPSLNIILTPVDKEARKSLDFRAGDTVRVWQKTKEKGKEGERIRLQAFEGIVLARKHGKEPGATFTVRKISSGVGVERIFPLYSPEVDRVEIINRASRHRRAKLYYIRDIAAREVRKKMKHVRASLAESRQEEVKREEKVASAASAESEPLVPGQPTGQAGEVEKKPAEA